MASGYADSVNGTALTETYLDDNLMKQAVLKYASAATRTADAALTAALREGMVSYQDDLNSLYVYSGSAWSTIGPVHGAYTTWSPVVTQSNQPTQTVVSGGYTRVGRHITGYAEVSITAAGTASNAVVVTIPVAAAGSSNTIIGLAVVYDQSATSKYQVILVRGSTTTTGRMYSTNGVTDVFLGVGGGFTAALASGDFVAWSFDYEAAADA